MYRININNKLLRLCDVTLSSGIQSIFKINSFINKKNLLRDIIIKQPYALK